MCDTRLALIAETAGNFKAQLLDLMKLRDQVRKAERIHPELPTLAMARRREPAGCQQAKGPKTARYPGPPASRRDYRRYGQSQREPLP
jgi:hypothetical protein